MSEESKVSNSDQTSPALTSASSCLRIRSDSSRKNHTFKVSFPEEESQLITGYLEPANPWEYAENVSREDLIATYKASCEKHGTRPLSLVLQQLETVDVEAGRSECFNLKGETLGALTCESLEEVLKRVQFKNINLESTALDDEGSVALFDMMEYYESATHLNISSNREIGVRGWQACSRMIKKTRCLEQLDARNVTLNEQYMPILSRALRIGTHLQILKLENCGLSGRPIIILAAALKLNTGLRELYLADNNLSVTDAIQLGALLRSNLTLQLLDISNNNIQDVGVGHISDGLIEQSPQSPQSGGGLCILVLWNNHLTRNSSKHFARAVARSKTLEILNMGQNVLTNECLHVMKDSLHQNRTLLRLGMQSTHLSCEGAIALAECIADNPVIQRIDLRDNNVQMAGLWALNVSMKVNQSVTQLDLDDTPKKKLDGVDSLQQYRKLVQEIRGYCVRNENAPLEEQDTMEEAEGTPERRVRLSSISSRKISLTCETLMRAACAPPEQESPHLLVEPRRTGGRLRSPAPSPVPSPVSSPVPSPSRNRFQVSRVSEPSLAPSPNTSSCSSSPITPPSLSSSPIRFFASPNNSRFRVTLVEPSGTRPCPKPIVTSPSGNNVTLGFSFKLNDNDITVNTSSTEAEHSVISNPIPVPTSKLPSVSIVRQTPQVVLQEEGNSLAPSHDVALAIDLAKNTNSMVLGGESNTESSISDSLEDTADLEVRQLMERPLCENLWDKPVAQEITASKGTSKSIVHQVNTLQTQQCTESEHCTNVATESGLITPKLISESLNSENKSKISPESIKDVDKGNVSTSKTLQPNPSSHRSRKISWIAPESHVGDQKHPTSLEKLLGLFHPSSFFNKAQPQYKATTVIVNQQPIANSNASFLLAAGPLADAAQEVRASGTVPELESPDDVVAPMPDVINNNNRKDAEGAVAASSLKMFSRCLSEEREHVRTRQSEDENLNISKQCEDAKKDVTEDGSKMWCHSLSSVCGTGLKSWTLESSPFSSGVSDLKSHSVCAIGDRGIESRLDVADRVGFRLTQESHANIVNEDPKDCGSASRLYASVMKNTPANGMNVSILPQVSQTGASSPLWSQTSEGSGQSCAPLLPVTSVRLVGGASGFSANENSSGILGATFTGAVCLEDELSSGKISSTVPAEHSCILGESGCAQNAVIMVQNQAADHAEGEISGIPGVLEP